MCIICGCDISDKKSGAKYCGKKCSNRHTNANLKTRTIKKVQEETENRNIFFDLLTQQTGNDIKLRYINKNQIRKKHTTTQAVIKSPLPYKQYRRITDVWIEQPNGTTIELTTMRAKSVFRELKRISQLN